MFTKIQFMNGLFRILYTIVFICCCSSVFAATDIFIRINGIAGSSQVAGFTAYSEVFRTGQTNVGCSATGPGGCNAVPGNFTFEMALNKATPVLQTMLFSGNQISSVDIVYSRATGGPSGASTVYYQVHLENVIVKSIAEVGSTDDAVNNQYAFSFAKIAWKYRPQNPDGSLGTAVIGCWNVQTNTGGTAGSCTSYNFPF